jgi:signal transduction histidine kinase
MDRKASPLMSMEDRSGGRPVAPEAAAQLRELAHELRNPLNALVAVAEVFRDERFGALPSDRYRRYAELAHEATLRMVSLCDQLLIERPDIAQDQPHLDPLPKRRLVCDSIRNVVEFFGPMAEERHVELNIQLSEKELANVSINDELVTSTLNNLVANAIKFTPSGGRVSVIAKRDTSADVVILVVSDTGVGLDPEQLALIMGVDSARPRKTTGVHGDQGSGLGLFMVRRSLEMAGGSLELRSKPGVGTCAIVKMLAR